MSEKLGALIQTRRIRKLLKSKGKLCEEQETILRKQEEDLLDDLAD